jgi:hypothetical protein
MPDDRAGRVRVKAVGLLSGGLDSTLAARLLQEQGVEVEGIHFATGFCKVDHRRALGRSRDRDGAERLANQALRAGADLDAPVEILDVSREYLREVVLHPRHGYGSAMNPCIDCRIFMLRRAADVARERGAEVVFTGEVVGQRPMSQHHAAMRIVEEESGLEGRLLRPLSAAHLPPTEAEKAGRIDRARLGSVHGRGRRDQLELARRLGIERFPAPSGGCCFLADPNFARRLRDLLSHRDPGGVGPEDLLLLKVGRHFRFSHDAKAVFGRDEAESRLLRLQAGNRWSCQVADGRGSFGILEGDGAEGRLGEAASLAVRYSARRGAEEAEVLMRRGTEERRATARPADEDLVGRWRL